ncbi:MAG: ornithine cyclodeaminase family protein [Bacteroidetes bacterium]|nr:ornithine cyclodeaminase family protein [Bacteroidota bacterium]
MPLILTRANVMSVLTMKDCMTVVEKAFLELVNGTAELPLRTAIKPPDGISLYMPAYLRESGALACKIVTVYKNNPSKYNIPTTIGTVLLQDPDNGKVICIMDGGYLTAVRTGAVSGIATQYLARKSPSMTAGIFGAGVQAKMQLWAMAEARPLVKAMVYDIYPESALKFSTEMEAKLGIQVEVSSNPEALLACDILCLATSSASPLFDGKLVKPGTHINGIGSHTPNAREMDTALVKRSKFVGDSRQACFAEAGDIIIPVSEGAITDQHYYADLGEIIKGIKAARVGAEEITIFKSNGLAIQDVATAKLVYEKALAAGIGQTIEI